MGTTAEESVKSDDKIQYGFCDLCLVTCTNIEDWLVHLHGDIHKHRKQHFQSALTQLFDRNDELLHQIKQWERCFVCGCPDTETPFTTVFVHCSRCSGSGGAPARIDGIPGSATDGGRFICRTHALPGWCSSCGTHLGFEQFQIDKEAVEECASCK